MQCTPNGRGKTVSRTNIRRKYVMPGADCRPDDKVMRRIGQETTGSRPVLHCV